MAPVFGRKCATHRLPIALALDLDSSGSEKCMFMKISAHLQQLSQHVDDIVPQPAHNSQIKARSVEGAVAGEVGSERHQPHSALGAYGGYCGMGLGIAGAGWRPAERMGSQERVRPPARERARPPGRKTTEVAAQVRARPPARERVRPPGRKTAEAAARGCWRHPC